MFGCLCYAANRTRVKDKFGPWSRRCIFVGYPLSQQGWHLFDLETRDYFFSRDVKFLDNTFSFGIATINIDGSFDLGTIGSVDTDGAVFDELYDDVLCDDGDALCDGMRVEQASQ